MTDAQEGFALYHWAPTSRRGQISRYGLRPGSLSSDRLWRPPFVCLADGPRAAWQNTACITESSSATYGLSDHE